MPYTLTTAIPLGQTGLTLSAQLYNTDGTTNGAAVTTGFVERPTGSGNYFWTYAGFPDGFRGGVVFTSTGGVFQASFGVNPEEAENTDVKTSTRATSVVPGAQINYVGPVAQSGQVILVRGDDYSSADGHALRWLEAAQPAWPVLTGASVLFKAKRPVKGTAFFKTGTVVAGTGTPKEVMVELTSAETLDLLDAEHSRPGESTYEVEATLSPSGRVKTLVRGPLRVEPDIR